MTLEEAAVIYSNYEGGYDFDKKTTYTGDYIEPFVLEQISEKQRDEENEYFRNQRQATVAPRPIIKVGYSFYFQGDQTPRQGVETWAYQINSTTGLNVSGIIYNVRLVLYNDGNDCNAKYVLYKYMAEFDNVTAFIAPTGNCFGSRTALGISNLYKIPMVNGANSIMAWFTPTSQLTYTWTLFPPIDGVTGECTAAMKYGCGLDSAVVLFLNGSQATSLYALQQTNLVQYNINATDIPIIGSQVGIVGTKHWNDSMDAIIKNLRDVVRPSMFIWSYYGGVTMLDRIRLLKYEPPAIFTWAGVALLPSRLAAGWRGRGLLALSAWDETTLFGDPVFGNSSVFVETYKKLWNGTIDTFSGVMGASVVVLGRAIEIAGTLDGVDINDALRNFNETIFFGPIYFNQTTHLIGLNDPCWQVQDDDRFLPVWPDTYPNTVPIKCPYIPTYPPPPPVYHNWAKFYGLRVALPIGIVLLIIFIVFFVMWARHKWYIIVINKGETNKRASEWGDTTASSLGKGSFAGIISNLLCFCNREQ